VAGSFYDHLMAQTALRDGYWSPWPELTTLSSNFMTFFCHEAVQSIMNKNYYQRWTREGVVDSAALSKVDELAVKVQSILQKSDIQNAISAVHKVGASSFSVQEALIGEMEMLGFESEKKGLFADFDVSGIRPDYFRNMEGGGILFEVERGKTIANNMDLLDVWKTHICQEAKHLFLLVPIIRTTQKGGEQKTFNSVEKRIGAFFAPNVPSIDVASVHLFGY
jgi:hypothetical protein